MPNDATVMADEVLKAIRELLHAKTENIVARVRALELSIPMAGKDGRPGLQGPQGEKGMDGTAGADGVAGPAGERGEKGEPGEPGPVGPAGPQGEKGADGRDGLDGIPGAAGDRGMQGEAGPAGPVGPQGEKGLDGSAGRDGVDGVVGARGEKGDPGMPGDVGPMGPMGERGEKGLDGLDGRDGQEGMPGRDAFEIQILPDIDFERSYPRGTYATHKGGLWRAGETTQGQRGWDCIVCGLADVEYEQDPNDSRKQKRIETLSDGRRREFEVRIDTPLHQGPFKAGTEYLRGDQVVFGGSSWVAMKATTDTPGTQSEAWVICARKGRDGKDGEKGERGEKGLDGRKV